MSTANPPPKRRFAPVPIETTFQSNRITNAPGGPATEPTPEPSPRSASPPLPPPPPPPPSHQPRQKRRFHPQLIETSRRTRRVGDVVPATRPTDKTDITPYTNHIYLAKSKHRRRNGDTTEDEAARDILPTRRESEDQGFSEYLLGLAGIEASTQMEEALAAFPNSRAREGGVAHFYFRESSDSSENAQRDQDDGARPRSRRKSSDLGLNWWHKHMQEHAQQLEHERLDDDDDDMMALDKEGHGNRDGDGDGDTIMRTDADLDKMDLPMPPDPLWTTTTTTTTSKRIDPADRRDSMADIQHLGSSRTPKDGDATVGRPRPDQTQKMDDFSSPGGPPQVRGAAGAGFARPFGAFGLKPEDPRALLIRQAASPPMLGKDLAFRQCPSPKQTKLETDHPFFHNEAIKQHNRDTTGQGGLWKGYCSRSESNKDLVVPAADFGSKPSLLTVKEPRIGTAPTRNCEPIMLRGVHERLHRQKAQAERDEKIASEFGDDFVTQVYNYLSLGYPATARSFDEELSKISRVPVAELSSRDHEQMAKGHMLEMKLDETPEEERCPRWKALRIYIIEWASQHPNLDNLDPMAWGVRERRGSWAI